MQLTITVPDNLAIQLQKLPNPNEFINGLIQKALTKPAVPPGMEINVMEMIQQIREEQYDAFKECKTVEQKVAFYREGARKFYERVKREKGIELNGLIEYK